METSVLGLVWLYKTTIAGGVLTAAALAWTGAHLAAQARAAQTLCIGQGASLGVLVGMMLVCTFQSDEALVTSPWPWIAGLASSLLVAWICERAARRSASRNVVFIALFAFIWSLSPLLSSLFPRIDDHLSQVYFGDLVTLSDRNIWLATAISVLTLGFLFSYSKTLNRVSFDIALTGPQSFPARLLRKESGPRAFRALSLLLICFSVQFLGLLFTIGMLFLPTVLLSRPRLASLGKHFQFAILISSLGTCAGFTLSLLSGKLSTVPTILVATTLLGALLQATANAIARRT